MVSLSLSPVQRALLPISRDLRVAKSSLATLWGGRGNEGRSDGSGVVKRPDGDGEALIHHDCLQFGSGRVGSTGLDDSGGGGWVVIG